MAFDTTKLLDWVSNLKKHGLFDRTLIDTLRFPTKSPSEKLTAHLNSLFKEVQTGADILGIDLKQAAGTFQIDYDKKRVYQPSIGAYNDALAIKWGKIIKPVSKVLADESVGISVREVGKGFELAFTKNGQEITLPFFLDNGITKTKSGIIQKLGDGTLYKIVTDIREYAEPKIALAKLCKGEPVELYVKSLKLTSKASAYGIGGVVEFYGINSVYQLGAKDVNRILERFDLEPELKAKHYWEDGECQFTIKGTKSGNINGQSATWLDWDPMNTSVSVDGFSYADDDEDEAPSGMGMDALADVFDYSDDE